MQSSCPPLTGRAAALHPRSPNMPKTPKIRLTDKFVSTVKPAAKGRRVIDWDAKQKGFGLLVTDTGHTSFVVQYQVGSGRKSRTLRRMHLQAKTVEEARTLAEGIHGEVSTGRALRQHIDPLEQRRQDDGIRPRGGPVRAGPTCWAHPDWNNARGPDHASAPIY